MGRHNPGWLPTLAHPPPLLSSLQLLLDVLRGPLFAHPAGGGLCERGQDSQMVLPARLAQPLAHHADLRLSALLRRLLHKLVSAPSPRGGFS